MNDPVRPLFPIGVLRDLIGKLTPLIPGKRPEGIRQPPDRDVSDDVLRAQVAVIRRAFEKRGDRVLGAPDKGNRPPRDDAAVHFLYRPSHALIRQQDFGRLAEYFGTEENKKRYSGELREAGSPIPDLLMTVVLPSRKDEQDDVLATLDELEDVGVIERGSATPDHIVYVTAKGHLCPYTEPELPPTKRPFPPVSRDQTAGRGVRVSVVDTGWWEPAGKHKSTPWVAGVTADDEDEEHILPAAIHPYGGHGTFVAGVVRCMAPSAEVDVEGALTHGGAVYESDLVAQLNDALNSELFPQLISISAGTHTRGGFAMLSFEMLASVHGLDDGEATLIVAAAGNQSSDEPFWPAAFPWVLSVGSVDPSGKVSSFSNVGPWVDVYARGSKHVNAFPTGTYTCYEKPNVGVVRTFDGLAQWSGTSFSTPIVTGLIAARMSATKASGAPEDVRAAAKAVLKAGTTSTDPRGGNIRTVGPLQ